MTILLDDGHQAFIAPAVPGMRALAIIVNSKFLHGVIKDSFLVRGRACSLRLSWAGWNLLLVCAHLCPKNSHASFLQSLADLQFLLNAAGDDHIVLSVDAQDGVGEVDDAPDNIVGPYGDGRKGWKGTQFANLMYEYGLCVWNTLHYDELGAHTCHFFLRTEPAQIDFMCSNVPRWAVRACRKLESDATPTDHWPILISLAARSARTARTLAMQAAVKRPKPIGWQMTDDRFNDIVLSKMSSYVLQNSCTYAFSDRSGSGSDLALGAINTDVSEIVTFTDGAFFSRRRVPTAGWCFIAYDSVSKMEDVLTTTPPLVTALGPFILDRSHVMFVGATQLSNNVAELSALIEWCFWALSFLNGNRSRTNHVFSVYSDSSYVVGLANGKFSPKENLHIALLMVHMIRQVRLRAKVNVFWIKGHSGIVGNDLADAGAKNGATPSSCAQYWNRNVNVTDWGEESFVSLLQVALGTSDHSASSSKTGVQFFDCTRRPRVTHCGQQIPSLCTITECVFEAATLCGRRRRARYAKVPADDPDVIELRGLESLRRQEACGVIRHWYSAQICKSRRKVRRKLLVQRRLQAAETGCRLR